jgi:hypothetical protein
MFCSARYCKKALNDARRILQLCGVQPLLFINQSIQLLIVLTEKSLPEQTEPL